MLSPGFAIFLTVIAYNVLGDVLRDIVDPKMQTGRLADEGRTLNIGRSILNEFYAS